MRTITACLWWMLAAPAYTDVLFQGDSTIQPAPGLIADQWLNASSSSPHFPQRGRVTVVEFTNVGCAPCIRSYPVMERLAAQYKARGWDDDVATRLEGQITSLLSPPSEQTITIDPAVRISPPGAGNHWATSIASAPDDPQHIIACGIRSTVVANSWQGFVYRSDDAGAHWAVALVDSSGQLVSEESCAFGPDGRAYFNAETWNLYHEQSRLGNGILRFYRSVDAGATWTPVIVDPTHDSWMDYARIGVDATNGPYRGRVYVFSNDGVTNHPEQTSLFPMRYSLDDGLHFSDRVQLPFSVLPRSGYPESVVVLPSGTVVAAYLNRYAPNGGPPQPIDTTKPGPLMERSRSVIQVVRSTTAGRTLDSPITVASGRGFPSVVVDRSAGPHHGRLYAAWSDTVGQVNRVVLASSDDDGIHWTDPRVVDDLEAPARRSARLDSASLGWLGALAPSLAVNRDGVVGLSWVESGTCWHFTASVDGGQTFAPSQPLNPCPRHVMRAYDLGTQLETVPFVDPTTHFGNPNLMQKGFTVRASTGGGASGLTADAAGVFHPLWNITGTDGQLWTTRVTVCPSTGARAPKAPDVSLLGLTDLSSQVTFSFTNQDYDAGTGLLTLDMTLWNTDSVPIGGPMRVEITGLGSGLATRVEVANADNGVSGAGAVWDVSGLLPGGALPGYGRSAPRRLVFRFPDGASRGPIPLSARQAISPLVSAEVKVFATPALSLNGAK